MADLKVGQRVRLTNPAYPDIDFVGTLLSTSLPEPQSGVYGTHMVLCGDGRRYRSEGVLHAA